MKDNRLETIFPRDGFDRVILRCIKIPKCQKVPVSVHTQYWKSKNVWAAKKIGTRYELGQKMTKDD